MELTGTSTVPSTQAGTVIRGTSQTGTQAGTQAGTVISGTSHTGTQAGTVIRGCDGRHSL